VSTKKIKRAEGGVLFTPPSVLLEQQP